ncbi:MAG: acyltransferase family protein [Pseudomonadota bacterium]
MTRPSSRRYDIDAIRVFAFSLLILYHVGMFYVADWGWHVKSAYQAEWLQVPMRFSNQWRMHILFLVSGLALSFVWGRYTPGRLALRRSWRLLLPLVFGMALIVAPQPYYEALSKGVIEPGFVDFMLRYLSFEDFPGEAWGGENEIVWTWNHLWYLPYVLLYTLVCLPLFAWFEGRGAGARKALQSLHGPWLIILPTLPLLACGLFVFPSYPFIDHSLFGDWYAHALYGTFFVYGFILGRSPALWRELSRLRWWTLGLGCLAFLALIGSEHWLPEAEGLLRDVPEAYIVYLNRWLWILVVLGWGHRLVDGPLPGLAYATEAVFSWYILHQTLTVVAGYELAKYELGPVLEPLLVLGATVGGCLLIHEFVIRRIPLLRPLFGLRYRAAPRPRVDAALGTESR